MNTASDRQTSDGRKEKSKPHRESLWQLPANLRIRRGRGKPDLNQQPHGPEATPKPARKAPNTLELHASYANSLMLASPCECARKTREKCGTSAVSAEVFRAKVPSAYRRESVDLPCRVVARPSQLPDLHANDGTFGTPWHGHGVA
jgi:hypothetical protein